MGVFFGGQPLPLRRRPGPSPPHHAVTPPPPAWKGNDGCFGTAAAGGGGGGLKLQQLPPWCLSGLSGRAYAETTWSDGVIKTNNNESHLRTAGGGQHFGLAPGSAIRDGTCGGAMLDRHWGWSHVTRLGLGGWCTPRGCQKAPSLPVTTRRRSGLGAGGLPGPKSWRGARVRVLHARVVPCICPRAPGDVDIQR